MFKLNILGSSEPLSIYVAKVDGSILGCIDDIIDETSASLSIGLNKQYELSFDITYCDSMTNWYDYIHEGIYLLVDKIGLFKVNQPSITNDGVTETKSVTAYSCESELEDKTSTVSINTGKEDSSEYLVEYVEGETEVLINPYTNLPYDWIVLYNLFPEQLATAKTKVTSEYYGGMDEDGNYNVTDSEKIDELLELFNLIPRLKHKIIPPSAPVVVDIPVTEEAVSNEPIYEEESIDEPIIEETAASSGDDHDTESTTYEYVSFVYSSDGNSVIKILLTSDFVGRVDELISYYTRYRNQLSLLSIILEDTGGWTVGDIYGVSNGDYSVANAKWQFEIDESIYSFLTNTLSKTTNSIITFDRLQRKVGIIPIEHLGNDTGIVMSYDTLINSLNINTDDERLTTRLKVSGGDGLSIRNVNFGSDYITDISYKLNAVGTDGNRIYVSDDLASRYSEYEDYVARRRETQITYMKRYEDIAEQIDELDNRVPNDSLKTDWGTFSQDELTAALTTYKNLLATLTALYKEDYGYAGLNGDGSINEDFISNTPYWLDYVAYKGTIKEIECAIDVFPYYSDQTKWTAQQIQEYKASISAWETTWNLFGIIELRAKIESYQQNMDVLAEEAVIRISTDSNIIKSWNELSNDEKVSYGLDQDSYKYDLYMSYYNNMQSAQDYLDSLIPQRETLEESLNAYKDRIERNVSVTRLENWFPESECAIIRRLYRDASYENDSIFITSTDTNDERIDKMVELLNDAKEQASIYSRPQIIFSVDSENLLGLSDFEPLWSSFIPGNYMMVQYKDKSFVKLRMIGFSFNPCLPPNNKLTIEFSNFIKAKSSYRDWASILGNNSGGGSGISSGSSGSTVFGSSDAIDVTISNTMLAKLLNTESFGAKVKEILVDTVNAEYINAKRATFTGLANGVTIIDGNCITTGVLRDLVYKGLVDDGVIENGSVNNTSGSVINLDNGHFNFAGGKIKYDGSLVAINSDVVIGGQDTIGEVLDDISTAQATADSKTKVYYGTPSTVLPPTYTLRQGDYLVDSTDGSTYRWDVGTSTWIVATNYASAIEDAIEDLEEEIIIQIDGKIETWTQSTNPATAWTTDAIRKKHDSDLWYYTGIANLTVDGVTIYPSKTYKYNYSTGKWVLYNSPNTSLFDFADSKTTIYYGSTTDTYNGVEIGDYLVDSTDGCTYKWNGTSWDKITDYNSAINTKATEIYSAIESLEDNLVAQIDGKVETWVQNTNPASSWDSSSLESHDGDLWYYNGISTITVDGVSIYPSKTYKYSYSTGKWAVYDSPSRSLFDLADGKSTIFYGTTSGTYSNLKENDYLVDNTDGCTYKWNGSAWVKVTDYANAISTSINSLREDLETQIDAKVETWVQNTDPISDWSSADRASHDGDLWYYNGLSDITSGTVTIRPSQTYQYNHAQGKWIAYKQPTKSLFDFADGKTTVYYGTPSGTYQDVETGDYLVDSTDGCTYKYSGTSWVKVTDYESSISRSINSLRTDLEGQIDSKIETWAQNTNPASSWSSTVAESHDGDLWYYTGIVDITIDGVVIHPSKTYKYNFSTGKWVLYNSPATSLFDLADGKTTIYYGSTSGTYDNVTTDDYLVDDSDGCTYKWSGTAWVKVTDYKTEISNAVNQIDLEIQGIESDLQEQIDSKIETWTQDENPKLSWTDADLPKHNGDLWFYTGLTDLVAGTHGLPSGNVTIKPSKTYQYNSTTNKWVLYNSPTKSLFDLADGKSTIYYGTTSDTFANVENGDYLVDATDGCTYKRQNNAWVKVTDYGTAINTAVNALEEDLQEQIDGKIETWAQNTNPASSWSVSELPSHDNDLWYYTGISSITVNGVTILPSKTYKYDYANGVWVLYNSPSRSLFDLADGKSTIFYGGTSGTYANVKTGDYLVDSSDGCTYKWNGSSWTKVTDYGASIESAINNLEAELVEQIDAKIETWAKSVDPASVWQSTDYESHDGDLWYYTGMTDIFAPNLVAHPHGVYQFHYNSAYGNVLEEGGSNITDESGNIIIMESPYYWTEYAATSNNLFDAVDGKSTIFYGSTSGTYNGKEVGDYLVDNEDGSTYRWDGTAWIKVTDYQSFTNEAIENLSEVLKEQIDGKVETWAQAENPALSWDDDELEAHNGDLWYYTGTTDISASTHGLPAGNETIKPSKTYQYNFEIGKWVLYNSPTTSLFDLADGKSTIYYGTPSGAYSNVESGDYLVDNTDGCTYKYSGTSWVKVTDYKTYVDNGISVLSQSLSQQIDAKIDTWVQAENPALEWASADLPKHNDDIWYYTGITELAAGTHGLPSGNETIKPSKTYRYNSSTGKWVSYNSPSTTLFDFADGKATVYYGTYPFTSVTSPNTNDVAIDSSTKKLYRYSGSSWSEVDNYTTAVSNLQGQIDKKIETYYQSTDPFSGKTSASLKANDGDLWFYTGSTTSSLTQNATYRYSWSSDTGTNHALSSWIECQVSENVFDKIDGKSTIYEGAYPFSSITSPSTNDMAVDSTTQKIYKYSGSSWIEVANYTTAFNNLQGQIDKKIETYYQSNNPFSGKTTASLEANDGDIWFYTGVSGTGGGKFIHNATYRYSWSADTGTYHNASLSWIECEVSENVFDEIDGKSTIHPGTYPFPLVTSPQENDIAVDDNTKKIYKYNGSSWIEVTNYSEAFDSLSTQIDAKIETWAQSTNPALSWTEVESHDGDLWLYTGTTDLVIAGVTIHPQGIYKLRYIEGVDVLAEAGSVITDESGNDISVEINYVWEQYSSTATNLFDMIDGKTTIYYGSTSSTYSDVEDGDYLVNPQNGTTYRRNGGQWTAVTKTGGLYGTCDTAATAKDKIVVCDQSISMYEGLTISVKFANANTYYSNTSPLTLSVGNLGLKNIYYNGKVISSSNRIYWTAGATIMFMYDGIGWIVIGNQQVYEGKCSTNASTVNKSCKIENAVIVQGTVVNITFTNTNSAASPTLNVIDNTTNAAIIVVNSGNTTLSSSSPYNWNVGATVGFTFDGTYWRMNETSALYNTNSYMRFEAAYGLMIANMTSGVQGIGNISNVYNTLLTSTDLQIRYGQTVLASFGSSIWLGNSANFSVTTNGILTAQSANISGTITATDGNIGGWAIDSDSIYKSVTNSDSTIPYTLATRISSSGHRFTASVEYLDTNNQKVVDTASIGRTYINNLNMGDVPRMVLETTSQVRDNLNNYPLRADGYTIAGDELYRTDLDYVNNTFTYVYKEYENQSSMITKEYNWTARYIFNAGATIILNSGNDLHINNGGVVWANSGARVPTRTSGDNSTYVANTAYVKTEAENIFDSKIKFIDVDPTVSPNVTIAANSVEIVTQSLSSSVPTGYKIRNVIWRGASLYAYFTATSIDVENNTSVKFRIRNLDTSSRTLSQVRITLICVPI